MATGARIIRGGRVIDPANGIDGVRDVRLEEGRIAAVGPELAANGAEELDARGKLVVPGLIDYHTHLYYHGATGLDADKVGYQQGCTAVVEQGSTGAVTFADFRELVVKRSITRVGAYMNVMAFPTVIMMDHAHPGLARSMIGGHFNEALIDVAERNRDVVRGIKVHMEAGGATAWGLEMMDEARAVADRLEMPMHLHTGLYIPAPGGLTVDPDDVIPYSVERMRPGDVLGHCYSPYPGSYLTRDGRLNPAVQEARRAGILSDVGHGNNFSFHVADIVHQAGVTPDIISSDTYQFGSVSLSPSPGLTSATYPQPRSMIGTMTKVMGLGVPLVDVIRASTVTPAKVLGWYPEAGTLSVGSRADVTVLDLLEGDFVMRDSTGAKRAVRRKLLPRATLVGGRLFELDPLSLPEFRDNIRPR